MNKKHIRVIREIQSRIPQELLMSLTKKVPQAAAVKKVFELALEKPDEEVAPRQKRAIRAMLDSGKLDRKVEVIDKAVETAIDEFITEEIAKAVKLGRLPKEAPKLDTLTKKGNQYARRQEKRLRAEFAAKNTDETTAPENEANNPGANKTRPTNHSFIPPTGADLR